MSALSAPFIFPSCFLYEIFSSLFRFQKYWSDFIVSKHPPFEFWSVFGKIQGVEKNPWCSPYRLFWGKRCFKNTTFSNRKFFEEIIFFFGGRKKSSNLFDSVLDSEKNFLFEKISALSARFVFPSCFLYDIFSSLFSQQKIFVHLNFQSIFTKIQGVEKNLPTFCNRKFFSEIISQ